MFFLLQLACPDFRCQDTSPFSAGGCRSQDARHELDSLGSVGFGCLERFLQAIGSVLLFPCQKLQCFQLETMRTPSNLNTDR